MKYLYYKEIPIAFTTIGKGKPIVFLHGFLENSNMWNSLIPNFSTSHLCICIDLLGHGKTANLGYVHTMEEMARAVKAVIDHLGITEMVCIGHSMGGYVALAFAALFPSMIEGIVLLNSTARPDSKERQLNRDRAITVVKQNPMAYTSMAIANLFAVENRKRFPKEILQVKDMAAQTSLQGIIAALEGMKIRKDSRTILSTYTKRKLIIAGKKDPVLPYSDLQKEAQDTHTSIVSLDGGHMSSIENQEHLIATLQHFLSCSPQ